MEPAALMAVCSVLLVLTCAVLLILRRSKAPAAAKATVGKVGGIKPIRGSLLDLQSIDPSKAQASDKELQIILNP